MVEDGERDAAVVLDAMRAIIEAEPLAKIDYVKMVDFEMTDSNGREQIVSIPKLSLLPLPLLRVAEATFDIEAQIDISTATKQDVEKFEKNYPIYNQKKKTSIDDLSKAEQEILLKKIKSLAGVRVRLSNQSTPKRRNPLLRSGKTTTKETTSMQKMTNVKVHIKLEPVLLPDGMRGLLQATENTIKVVDKQN